ncbi:unnamed protein product [Haemonchus placei]|uniref:Beta-galactosidase n=1 Tax=Haemonchus placei TaxID=6290 RepID=A0A0N4WX20_HAEPC|nr:unnamed protein product [Haemonchus placei]
MTSCLHSLWPLLAFGLTYVSTQRSFSIDHDNNQFLRDGKPYRYISGSIHYFRTHPDQWETRLQTVRAAGLNSIETYIPWNFHETYKNKYDFSGMRNFSRFFELAAQNELAVIVRPGPYICGEWENGGLPYWLLKYPNITQRSSDPNFLRESLAWWDVLLPMIRPYLWQNNGPVIMIQIENEYGSFGCDHVYLRALRDKAIEKLGNDSVLFTTDPPETIECGVIDGVYATVDFGERGLILADDYFKIQDDANKKILELTEKLYNMNASFNYYMFHGGTNFGFWNGAEYAAGLDQPMGFVKYSVHLNVGGSVLDCSGVRDFGYVFVNKQFRGRVSPHYKPHEVKELQLSLKRNDLLEIVVENQGRLTWETINDYKGIVNPVKLDGAQLTGWTSCAVDVEQLVDVTAQSSVSSVFNVGDVFRGDLTPTGKGDTFIDMSNWGKGVAWLNGFNLGRYWASAGPQKYLYVPAPLITTGKNSLVFLELEKLSSDCKGTQCSINLLDHPLLYK